MVTYIASDGGRLRSAADVEKYLRKCGLESSLPQCLELFDFTGGAGEGGNASGQNETLSAKDTPVKHEKEGDSQKTRGKRPAEEAEDDVKRAGSRAKRTTIEATAEDKSPEPDGRKRNRDLAKSRATAFAFGRGFVDDEGRGPAKPAGGASSKKGGKKGKDRVGEDVGESSSAPAAENETEGERESWPGPWATASALYTKRGAAAEARKGSASGAEKKVVTWKPAAGAKKARNTPSNAMPSLQNMCIDMVSTHIEACLEHGLGSILPDMKAKICENLCKKRRLLPDVLPIFTDCETHTLSLPDCSYIGEQEMAEAFQRCQGPALEVLRLKYCGRSMSDKLLEDLSSKAANLHTLQLGGCYRVSDKGIAAAVKSLPHLRVLELSDCRHISVEALRSVASVGDTLESLSLKNSTQLDSEALLQLAALKNLKRLSLSGCRGASDVIVEMLVESCGASLEELDLSHLPDSGFTAEPNNCRITDTSLEALASKCSNLRKLTLRNCDAITDRGILGKWVAAAVCLSLPRALVRARAFAPGLLCGGCLCAGLTLRVTALLIQLSRRASACSCRM